jgi:hypothetical protein
MFQAMHRADFSHGMLIIELSDRQSFSIKITIRDTDDVVKVTDNAG